MEHGFTLGSRGLILPPQVPVFSSRNNSNQASPNVYSGVQSTVTLDDSEDDTIKTEAEEHSEPFVIPPPQLPPPKDPVEEQLFQFIWRRIWSHERHLFCRGKNKSQVPKKKEVWPLDREEAFWRAIIHWPPRGRRTVLHRGIGPDGADLKLGRNESIAAFINETLSLVPNPLGFKTKEGKDVWPEWDNTPVQLRSIRRKKISSKLQVIRNWLERDIDTFVYHWVQGDHDKDQSAGSAKRTRTSNKSMRRQPPRLTHISSTQNDSTVINEELLKKLTQQAHLRSQATQPVLKSQSHPPRTSLVNHFGFHMSLYNSKPPLDGFNSVHVFTRTVLGAGMPDTRISSTDLYDALPELTDANPVKHTSCPLVFAEASLALPPEDLALDSLDLAIEGRVATPYMLDQNCKWFCRTVFQDDVKSYEQPEQILKDINSTDYGDAFCHSLPFCSKFWVKRVESLVKDSREASRLELDIKTEVGVDGYLDLQEQIKQNIAKKVDEEQKKKEEKKAQKKAQKKPKKRKRVEAEDESDEDDTDDEQPMDLYEIYDRLRASNGVKNSLKSVKVMRDNIARSIMRLTARQEILAYPPSATPQHDLTSTPTTHLIICWRFRQTTAKEIGITQFRKLSITLSERDINISTNALLEMPAQTEGVQDDDPAYQPKFYEDNYNLDILASTAVMDSNAGSSYSFLGIDQPHSISGSGSGSNVNTDSTLCRSDVSHSSIFDDIWQEKLDLTREQTEAGTIVDDQLTLQAPAPENQGRFLNFIHQMERLEQDGNYFGPSVNSFDSFDQTLDSSGISTTTSSYPASAYALAPDTYANFSNSRDDSSSSQYLTQCPEPVQYYPTPGLDLSYCGTALNFETYGSLNLELPPQQENQGDTKVDEQYSHNLCLVQPFTAVSDEKQQTSPEQHAMPLTELSTGRSNIVLEENDHEGVKYSTF